ncbi:MAG: hypothetical protein L0Y44_09955 [Phycisphaerales bacterium]|nr:hypothetical protein [Phycisphaerales bacterium]MCI0630960.1 hypothetical protein [Phycisphaerales bacterium]MCI0674323.1 hypothetical protein [Phycisphaerales bacterium]
MSQFSATGSLWLPSLLEIFERQNGILDRLDQLSEVQSTVIADGRTDRLLDLLGKRQRLIDELLASQTGMSELTGDLGRRVESIAPLQRDRIASMVKAIGERLARVINRDEKDQQTLGANRDQPRLTATRCVSARHARTAYRTVAQAPVLPARRG